jgi:hypothetical protein
MGVDSFNIIDNESYASDPTKATDDKRLDIFKKFFSSQFSGV